MDAAEVGAALHGANFFAIVARRVIAGGQPSGERMFAYSVPSAEDNSRCG